MTVELGWIQQAFEEWLASLTEVELRNRGGDVLDRVSRGRP